MRWIFAAVLTVAVLAAGVYVTTTRPKRAGLALVARQYGVAVETRDVAVVRKQGMVSVCGEVETTRGWEPFVVIGSELLTQRILRDSVPPRGLIDMTGLEFSVLRSKACD